MAMVVFITSSYKQTIELSIVERELTAESFENQESVDRREAYLRASAGLLGLLA
jgi:hypothetical protein